MFDVILFACQPYPLLVYMYYTILSLSSCYYTGKDNTRRMEMDREARQPTTRRLHCGEGDQGSERVCPCARDGGSDRKTA